MCGDCSMKLLEKKSSIVFFNFVTVGSGFVTVILLTRLFDPSAIGKLFLFQSILVILSLPTEFGVMTAVAKRISEGDQVNKFIGGGLLLTGITTLIFSVVASFAAGVINQYVGIEVVRILIITLATKTFLLLFRKILEGYQKVGLSYVFQMIRHLLFLFIILIAYYKLSMKTPLALIQSYAMSYIITLLLSFFILPKDVGLPNQATLSSLVSFSKYIFVSRIGGYFYNWADVIFIGIFLTDFHVGLYEVAWRATMPFLLIAKALGSSIFPKISSWHTNNDIQSIRKEINNTIPVSVLLVIPGFFGSIIIGSDLLSLVFGEAYAGASLVLIILIAEKILASSHQIFSQALLGINKPEKAAIGSLLAISTNIVLNILLIPPFNIEGAALATALSFVVNSGVYYYYLDASIDIKIPIKPLLIITVLSIIMMGFTYALFVFISPVKSAFELTFIVIFGTTVYFFGIYISNMMKYVKYLQSV